MRVELPSFVSTWYTSGAELATEYTLHISFPDEGPDSGHELQGITQPAFFDTRNNECLLDHRAFVSKIRFDE